MSAVADPQDEVVTVVTITQRHTGVDSGSIEFHGPDRKEVLRAAIARFFELQDQNRNPTFPQTYPAKDGGWRVFVSYWGAPL